MLGVHAMTVSKWERGTATPTPYNIQQLTLLEQGAEDLNDAQRRQFGQMLAMGLFAGALAVVIGVAVGEVGRRRGWW